MSINEEIEQIFGDIALERNILTVQQLAECELKRRELKIIGTPKRLGEVMMEKGFIDKAQALSILKEAHIQSGHKPRIGGYELLKSLGSGAMGAVYLAKQVSMDRNVALKLLPRRLSKDEDFVRRFMREAKMCAKLNHRNIVSAIDVGESNGYNYFAMEYIEGKSLEKTLEKKKVIDEETVITIAVQAIEGLQHATKHNVVHRDIKPANIMICKDGTVKIADMGLAINSNTTSSSAAMSSAGIAVGTPYYMAPEQVEGRTDLDFRTDMYALGATLFEAVTGERPWDAANVPAIMAKRLYEDPRLACDVRKGVSRGFSSIIFKMMSRSKDGRYQSLEALLEDIQKAGAGKAPESVRKIPRRKTKEIDQGSATKKKTTKGKKPIGQVEKIMLAGVVVLVGLSIAVILASMSGGGPRHPNPRMENPKLWEPYAERQCEGEKARKMWEEARNLQHVYDNNAAATKDDYEAVKKAYQALVDAYPTGAYSARAKIRIETLNPAK